MATSVPGDVVRHRARDLCGPGPYAQLLDPGRINDAGRLWLSTWPPFVSTTKAPAMTSIIGLDRCLRFVLAVTRHDARLASGCLARRDIVTRRVATKRFRVRVSSPFPGLILTL